MKHLKTFNESENMFTTIKRMYKKEVGTYEEPIHIYIKIFNDSAFIEAKFMDTKVNQYLMGKLDEKFDLNFIKDFGLNKLKNDKIYEVKDFLINVVKLQFIDVSNGNNKEYLFKGKMSVKDLKNII
jgi:hypothetical protein